MRLYFEYHCYEGEDSADAELWHHTHQMVEVLYQEPWAHGEFCYADPIMWQVRFDDGFEWSVFDDELLYSERDYERPDYTPGGN